MSFSMRIATWNINSVRPRINHILWFIKEQNIDVMCLQETKTEDEYFLSNSNLIRKPSNYWE